MLNTIDAKPIMRAKTKPIATTFVIVLLFVASVSATVAVNLTFFKSILVEIKIWAKENIKANAQQIKMLWSSIDVNIFRITQLAITDNPLTIPQSKTFASKIVFGFIARDFIFKNELLSLEMFVAQNVFVNTVKINKTAKVSENVILIPKEFNINVSNNE